MISDDWQDWELEKRDEISRVIWKRRPSRCKTYWDYYIDTVRTRFRGGKENERTT